MNITLRWATAALFLLVMPAAADVVPRTAHTFQLAEGATHPRPRSKMWPARRYLGARVCDWREWSGTPRAPCSHIRYGWRRGGLLRADGAGRH